MAPRTLRSSIACAAVASASCTVAALGTSSARARLIRGVSYGPVPLKSQAGASELPEDDWFCDEAVPMWGLAGRADLRTIRNMGANMVRLYGNNPANDHTNFLDEAWAEGLSVAPGMSDYPYFQQVGENCLAKTDFNCFSQVKPLYEQNLRNGFLTMRNEYHPALKYFNILNEPDLKMPSTADFGGEEGTKQMARAIISAFDAMLEAEKELGVVGPLINFTATFSYAVCSDCGKFPGKPALGQIWRLDDAMHHPEDYGYTPKNDILAAYQTRFVHSFNTQNPATDLKQQFLDDYIATFPSTPVYIGEYHRVDANQTEDLETIYDLAEKNPLFLGISYFEYQVAYWKTGSEMNFGMFGLGSFVLAEMPYFSKTYSIYCLAPEASPLSGMSMPDAVSKTYGGAPVDTTHLCQANPLAVPLNQEGFETVAAQKGEHRMASFIERTINHMGGTVSPDGQKSLSSLAAEYLDASPNDGFATLAGYLGGKPAWASFDAAAECVANRNVGPSVVGAALGWTCSKAKSFSCDDLPSYCNNTYRIGDYVFSRYYKELGAAANPIIDCDFGGAAFFASPKIYDTWTGSTQCVSGGTTFTTTRGASTSTWMAPSRTASTSTFTETSATSTGSSAEVTTTRAVEGTTTVMKFLDMKIPESSAMASSVVCVRLLLGVALSVLMLR